MECMPISRRSLLLSTAALARAAAGAPTLTVKAKRKPSDAWSEYPTRLVSTLPGFAPGGAPPLAGKWGGRNGWKRAAAGYFRVAEERGRWWLLDPEGRPFIKAGVCSTAPGRSQANRAAFADRFGGDARWAEDTVKLLRSLGFNGVGGWSAVDLFRAAPDRLVYTPSWSFAAGFGKEKKLTFQQPGHTGFAGDAIPVFHPEFEAWCDAYARRLAAYRDDPWLLGHYSDNELPAYADILDRSLRLDPATPALAPAYTAAKGWLAARRSPDVTLADVNAQDRDAYLEHIFDRYFRLTTAAIRKYDPNHLCLGSRLHGGSLKHPGALRAAGRHLEAVAVNVYGRWTPEPELFEAWRTHLRKPVIVTEFYAKGADSGFANTTGAGWLVPTQRDRARFYQHFLLAMLESRQCVGWDWFKYMDNDPEDASTDPSNRDSNKGLVNNRYQPYADLAGGMREFNREIYPLIDYFDRA